MLKGIKFGRDYRRIEGKRLILSVTLISIEMSELYYIENQASFFSLMIKSIWGIKASISPK